jgi:hypothetical protein
MTPKLGCEQRIRRKWYRNSVVSKELGKKAPKLGCEQRIRRKWHQNSVVSKELGENDTKTWL